MIRQFRPDDADACLSLILESIRQDRRLSFEVRDALLRAETPDTMRERSTLYYVVVDEREGEIAAVGGVDMNEIRLLFVGAARRREGIGSGVLEHLEEMVPPALFREIFVYAAPGAEAFYQSQGYVARGAQPFEAHGVVLESTFMVKPLHGA
jgi:GNAT superfamily N-acetyltransferase